MKRGVLLLAGLFVLYAASGFYIVKGNERAVVRRFGRAVVTPAGGVELVGSGLHYDWPWPLARIDRVNLSAIHTLTVGGLAVDETDAGSLLRGADMAAASQSLTGDKNILHVQVAAQYRIAPAGVGEYLFASESADERLRRLVEAVATDLVARSGVDYVHPLGLAELRQRLTLEVRRLAERQRLGLEIEEVTVAAVAPPLRVKADFLDVSNARADKDRAIQTARAYAEQRRQTARAEALEVLNAAESDRQRLVERARGAADSFTRLVRQLRSEAADGTQSYAAARQMALQRRYLATVQEILSSVADKAFLDAGKPVDLTILRKPAVSAPASAAP